MSEKNEIKNDDLQSCLALVLWVPLMIFDAFVASSLWYWFAVPQFNVQPLTIPVAIGLNCLYWVFAYTYRPGDSPDKETTGAAFLERLLVTSGVTLGMWGVGAAVHFWWK